MRKEDNLDNLIRDLKTYVTYFDGLDIDLEWMYNASDWKVYNHIVERIAKEVMVDHPDKILTCSLHSVSYNGFNKDLVNYVDYFTFQLYGPNLDPTNYNYYTDAYNWFVNYGYPKDKILLSYSILTQTGVVEGYKDLFEKYGLDDTNYSPSLTSWNCNGTVKKFNSVELVRKKQNFVIDQDVRGTMYFDMGNDLKVTDKRSLIHAQNEIISSNVDTLITEVDMSHVISTGIQECLCREGNSAKLAKITMLDMQTINVELNDPVSEAMVEVYTLDGTSIFTQNKIKGMISFEVPAEVGKQVYIVRIVQNKKQESTKIYPL